jgi:hypothetical protein
MEMGKTRAWPENVQPGDWSNDLLTIQALRSFARRASFAATLIPPGASILDVGCAKCAIRPFLAEGVRYTGCDLEPAVRGVQRVNIDAHEFPEGHWDYVLFLGVLSWVAEKDWALRTARQRARFAIITNGEREFGAAVRAAGWTFQKEIIGEVSDNGKVPIDLYG